MAATVPRPCIAMPAAQRLAASYASQQRTAPYGTGTLLHPLRSGFVHMDACMYQECMATVALAWAQAWTNAHGIGMGEISDELKNCHDRSHAEAFETQHMRQLA